MGKQQPDLSNIHVLTVDPGGLLDSRAFSQPDVPFLWKILITVAGFLQPLVKFLIPKMNTSAVAARDVGDLAVAEEFVGKEGHFVMRAEEDSSPDSHDERMQEALFWKSVEWCGITQDDTVLSL